MKVFNLGLGNRLISAWEKLFNLELSLRTRIVGSAIIGTIGFMILFALQKHINTYLTLVTVITSLIISFFAGGRIALVMATILGLVSDYFFIEPIHSIFNTEKSYEHFGLVFVSSLFLSLLAGSLRSAFLRLSEAKKLAENATSEAHEASMRMEKVLALVSHDVRNPLCTSRMAAQLLLESPENTDRRSRAVVIIRNLDRADQLIQSLLDVTRIRTSGRAVPLHYQHCDLRAQVSYLIDELSLTHGNRLIYVAERAVWGDWATDAIRRALENLIANAVKYGTPDFPVIVSLRHDSRSAVLSVHNQGNEIAPADQARLFDFFQRGIRAQDQGQGWGIGLAVVKAVAESHGGKVSVESGSGLGTKFIITVPSHVESRQESRNYV